MSVNESGFLMKVFFTFLLIQILGVDLSGLRYKQSHYRSHIKNNFTSDLDPYSYALGFSYKKEKSKSNLFLTLNFFSKAYGESEVSGGDSWGAWGGLTSDITSSDHFFDDEDVYRKMKRDGTNLHLTDPQGNEVMVYRLRSSMGKDELSRESLEVSKGGLDEMYRNMAYEDAIIRTYYKDPRVFREHLRIIRDEKHKLRFKGTSYPHQTLRQIDASNLSYFGDRLISHIPPLSVSVGVAFEQFAVGGGVEVDVKKSINESTLNYMDNHKDEVFAVAEVVRKSMFFQAKERSFFDSWFSDDLSKEDQLSTALNESFRAGYGRDSIPETTESLLTESGAPYTGAITFNRFSMLYPEASEPYNIIKNSGFIQKYQEVQTEEHDDLRQGQVELTKKFEVLISDQIIYYGENGEPYTIKHEIINQGAEIQLQGQDIRDLKELSLSSDPVQTKLEVMERDAHREINRIQQEIDSINHQMQDSSSMTVADLEQLKSEKEQLSHHLLNAEKKAQGARQNMELLKLDRAFGKVQQSLNIIGQVAQMANIKNAPRIINGFQGAVRMTKGIATIAKMAEMKKLTGLALAATTGDIAGGLSAVFSMFANVPSADEMILEQLGKILENQQQMMQDLNELKMTTKRIESKVDHLVESINILGKFIEEGFNKLNQAMAEGFESVKDDIHLLSEKVSDVHSDILANRDYMEALAQEEAFRDLKSEVAGVLSNFEPEVRLDIHQELIDCKESVAPCTEAAKGVMYQVDQLMGRLSYAVSETLVKGVSFQNKDLDYLFQMSTQDIESYLNSNRAQKYEEHLRNFISLIPAIGEWLNENAPSGSEMISVSTLSKAIHPGYLSSILQNYVLLALNLPIPLSESNNSVMGLSASEKRIDQICTKAIEVKDASKEMREKGLPLAWAVYKQKLDQVKNQVKNEILKIISHYKRKFHNSNGGYISGDYLLSSDQEISHFVNSLSGSNYENFAIRIKAVGYKRVEDRCIQRSRTAEGRKCTDYEYREHGACIIIGAPTPNGVGCTLIDKDAEEEEPEVENLLNLKSSDANQCQLFDDQCTVEAPVFQNNLLGYDCGPCGYRETREECIKWEPYYKCAEWSYKNVITEELSKSRLISKIKDIRNNTFQSLKQDLKNTLNVKSSANANPLIHDILLSKLAIQSLAYGGYGKYFVDYSPEFQNFHYELNKAPTYFNSDEPGVISWMKPDGETSILESNTSFSDFNRWLRWMEGDFKRWEIQGASFQVKISSIHQDEIKNEILKVLHSLIEGQKVLTELLTGAYQEGTITISDDSILSSYEEPEDKENILELFRVLINGQALLKSILLNRSVVFINKASEVLSNEEKLRAVDLTVKPDVDDEDKIQTLFTTHNGEVIQKTPLPLYNVDPSSELSDEKKLSIVNKFVSEYIVEQNTISDEEKIRILSDLIKEQNNIKNLILQKINNHVTAVNLRLNETTEGEADDDQNNSNNSAITQALNTLLDGQLSMKALVMEKSITSELPLDDQFKTDESNPLFFTVYSNSKRAFSSLISTEDEQAQQKIKSDFVLGFGEPLEVYKALEIAARYDYISPGSTCIEAFELESVVRERNGNGEEL